jgi:hypothetical protein
MKHRLDAKGRAYLLARCSVIAPHVVASDDFRQRAEAIRLLVELDHWSVSRAINVVSRLVPIHEGANPDWTHYLAARAHAPALVCQNPTPRRGRRRRRPQLCLVRSEATQ